MPCDRPFILQNCGINPETGNKKVVFLKNFSGNYEDYSDDRFIRVPCGQCTQCRLDYAKVWGERCSLEASLYGENNMFLTLTYSDEYVPDVCSKKDFQLFIKRLRNYFKDDKLRFFGCCERGSLNYRPHFHIIIFNARFDDLRFFSKKNDNILFTSETLKRLWPYGFSTIGECNYTTCNYTARYILKKQLGVNKTDEFVLMSRRPGIGALWFEKNKDKLIQNNLIYFKFSDTKNVTYINKYFKKLLNKYNPDYKVDLDEMTIKLIQEKLVNDKQCLNLNTDLELYQRRADYVKNKIKKLKRGL